MALNENGKKNEKREEKCNNSLFHGIPIELTIDIVEGSRGTRQKDIIHLKVNLHLWLPGCKWAPILKEHERRVLWGFCLTPVSYNISWSKIHILSRIKQVTRIFGLICSHSFLLHILSVNHRYICICVLLSMEEHSHDSPHLFSSHSSDPILTPKTPHFNSNTRGKSHEFQQVLDYWKFT